MRRRAAVDKQDDPPDDDRSRSRRNPSSTYPRRRGPRKDEPVPLVVILVPVVFIGIALIFFFAYFPTNRLTARNSVSLNGQNSRFDKTANLRSRMFEEHTSLTSLGRQELALDILSQSIHHPNKKYAHVLAPEGTKNLELYSAGIPRFSGVFARDSILSALLLESTADMRGILTVCTRIQGVKKNARTGEEPGRIFHEFPPVRNGQRNTLYAAADTTLLFVIGLEWLFENGDISDKSFVESHLQNLQSAIGYIKRHIDDRDLFVEDPKFAGAKAYSLDITYWKDSQVWDRTFGQVKYPVVYSLVQAQAIKALRSAASLVKSLGESNTEAVELTGLANRLRDKLLSDLWGPLDDTNKTSSELSGFYVGLDTEGILRGISSDSLHLLWFLEPSDFKDPSMLEHLVASSGSIESPVGYRCLDSESSRNQRNVYHMRTSWPFEQAFIHQAATRFNLPRVKDISCRMSTALSMCRLERNANNRSSCVYPEYFRIAFVDGNAPEREGRPAGMDPQLWTVAASAYFDSISC